MLSPDNHRNVIIENLFVIQTFFDEFYHIGISDVSPAHFQAFDLDLTVPTTAATATSTSGTDFLGIMAAAGTVLNLLEKRS